MGGAGAYRGNPGPAGAPTGNMGRPVGPGANNMPPSTPDLDMLGITMELLDPCKSSLLEFLCLRYEVAGGIMFSCERILIRTDRWITI